MDPAWAVWNDHVGEPDSRGGIADTLACRPRKLTLTERPGSPSACLAAVLAFHCRRPADSVTKASTERETRPISISGYGKRSLASRIRSAPTKPSCAEPRLFGARNSCRVATSSVMPPPFNCGPLSWNPGSGLRPLIRARPGTTTSVGTFGRFPA